MECGYCGATVAEKRDIMFYNKKVKDVHLTIKPELESIFESKKTIIREKERKKERLKCNACKNNLGVCLPFGPNGTSFFAFACDKVKINSVSYARERWHSVYQDFSIEIRDTENYFKTITNDEEACQPSNCKKISTPIKFASLTDFEKDFEWYSVSIKKIPHDYQKQAYIEALQRNLVVVLNTGSGKTLVATMILARMCSLNPDRMGLLLVDRVPLVFQQGDAIAGDAELKVASVCGENKTQLVLSELNNQCYEVLVITAGAFKELVLAKRIDVSLFSCIIFDECHHLVGGHVYLDVMKLFTKQQIQNQPRIVGLSASPFSATTSFQGEKNLHSFQLNFPEVKIFCPAMPPATQETLKKIIDLSDNQQAFINHVVPLINDALLELGTNIDETVQMLTEDVSNMHQIVGDIRTLQDKPNRDAFKKYFDFVMILIEAIDECVYLGVHTACSIIKHKEQFQGICKKFQNIPDDSIRLQTLEEYIKKAEKESKTLVFVKKRSIGRSLTKWAKKTFPDLNPLMIVGHGGYDGMEWTGEQDKTIQRFSNDDCNLLISTTVLEEGIDVKGCDLVIGYTGTTTLIQFIQMRGRARKENSKFILFETKEEHNRKTNAEQQEKLMKAVLEHNKIKSCHFTEQSKSIMKAIEEKMSLNPALSYENQDFNTHSEKNDLSVILYVPRGDAKNTSADIQRRVMIGLQQQLQCCKLERLLEIKAKENKLDVKSVTDSDTFVYLANFSTKDFSMTTEDIYQSFCLSYKFKINNKDAIQQVWAKRTNIKSETMETDLELHLSCQSYAIGYFRNKESIDSVKDFDFPTKITFTAKKHLKITKDEKFATIIHLNTLHGFAFTIYERKKLILVITLSSVPQFERYDYNERKGCTEISRLYESKDETIFSTCPVIMLSFDLRQSSKLQDILSSPVFFPVPVFSTNIFIKTIENDIVVDNTVVNSNAISWALKCIIDSRRICFSENAIEEIQDLIDDIPAQYKDEICVAALLQLLKFNQPYFTNTSKLVDNSINILKSIINTDNHQMLQEIVPKNHVLLKRVVITPTRTIALQEQPVPLSRLLRYTTSKGLSLVIVAFRDEDLSKIQDVTLLNRYKDILSNYIGINEKRYFYFSSTGSQLRDHKAYFINAIDHDEVVQIRNKVIPNPENFTSVAKYLSRLGMYGTSDIYACELNDENIVWGDDEKAANGDLTTDGAGLIKLSKAKQISIILNLDHIPSAFQIRYSGVKGILVCTHDDDLQLKGKDVLLRPSMKKFVNNDRKLCIAGYSKINKLVLNREIITLFTSSSLSTNVEPTLFKHLNKSTEKAIEIFHYEHKAKEALTSYLSSKVIKDISKDGLKFLHEAYWFKILQGIYRLKVRELKTKMNIPIELGCLLTGVPDTYHVLKENEIFVQVKRDLEDAEIIEKEAVIYRNPCLHPGDYRRVKCVNKPELQHLVNVVVLPTFGCNKSLASLCSGGDLDGDKFSVIWDSDLIPIDEVEPCDYSNIGTKTPNNTTIKSNVTSPVEVADFYAKFMTNDSLGKIATLHLALCDILPRGARDPLAVKLSESQSSAVDFPKTGIAPSIPKEAKLTVNKYPDFMEKALETSYNSDKPLGALYRQCQSATYEFNMNYQFDQIIFHDNEALQIKDYEKYLEDAEKVYKLYRHHIEMLLAKYDLQDETDIILADATYGWKEQQQASKAKITQVIKSTHAEIVQIFREIFFSNISTEEEKKSKAYAWYYLVNNKGSKLKDKSKLLSFPWVVGDILGMIKTGKATSSTDTNIQIGKSAIRMYQAKKSSIAQSVKEKLTALHAVRDRINKFTLTEYGVKNCFLTQVYGSTSIYLCDPESDIDICVIALNNVFTSTIIPNGELETFRRLQTVEQTRHFLKLVVSRAIDSIAKGKRELVDSHFDIPLIKFLTPNGDHPINCDITMNANGLRKTYYIQFLYKQNPVYFIVFWILIQWARAAEIIKSDPKSNIKIIDTADFYALIIHVLKFPEAPPLKDRESVTYTSFPALAKLLAKLSRNQKHELGGLILTFFRNLSDINTEVDIVWPVQDVSNVIIKEADIKVISVYSKRAYHSLSIKRNVEDLITYFRQSSDTITDFAQNLGRSLSYTIGKSKTFFQDRLSEITGAKITISENDKKELMIYAKCTRAEKIKLREELHCYRDTSRAIHEGQLPLNTSRYFMEGSSLVLPPQDTIYNSRVHFKPSIGAFEPLHATCERTSIFISDLKKELIEEWKEKRDEKFYSHVYKQMKMFPVNNEAVRDRIEISTRYGCLYFVNVSSTLPQSSIDFEELNIAMEKGKRLRIKWDRDDFHQANQLTAYRMVKLIPQKRRVEEEDIKEIVSEEMKRKKRRKTGVASAFTPGLLENNVKDTSVRKRLIKIYEKVLIRCGFKQESDGTGCLNRMRMPWKITVVPSTSFEVQLYMDAEGKLVSVEERPLNWVHATLITGEEQKFYNKIQANADIRITLVTNDIVKEGTDLYKSVLMHNGVFTLPVKFENGQPKLNEETPKSKKVSHARKTEESLLFTNGHVDASIIFGVNFSLKELTTKREFCEMSLYSNPIHLQESLKDSLNEEKLKKFTDEVIHMSVFIKETFEKVLEEENHITSC